MRRKDRDDSTNLFGAYFQVDIPLEILLENPPDDLDDGWVESTRLIA